MRNRRRIAAIALIGALMAPACSGGDEPDAAPPVASELPDPCRLVTSSTLRRETGRQYRVVDADEGQDPDSRSCSWIEVPEDGDDGAADPAAYLDIETPRYLDLALMQSTDELDVDAVVDEVRGGDDEVVEQPTLVVGGGAGRLADDAFSVGGTLYARKGDRLLVAATRSAEDLDDLAETVLPRLVGRI